jgi:hypothetical protein
VPMENVLGPAVFAKQQPKIERRIKRAGRGHRLWRGVAA